MKKKWDEQRRYGRKEGCRKGRKKQTVVKRKKEYKNDKEGDKKKQNEIN